MYAVGKLSTYISQGVYTVAGPFHPFGGAIDIIAVQQQDGSFKSTPWNVKFGKFQGVLKRREKLVDVAVNDVEADFHMYLDHKGEAYFLEDAGSVNDDNVLSPSSAPSSGDEGPVKPLAIEYHKAQELETDERPPVQEDDLSTKNESSVSGDEGLKLASTRKEEDYKLEKGLQADEKGSDVKHAMPQDDVIDGLDSTCVTDSEPVKITGGVLEVTEVSTEELSSSRAVIKDLARGPDESTAHNGETMHKLLSNAIGLEECRVSGPASVLIANNAFSSFAKVASTSDQLSGGLDDASTPSHISKLENDISLVESDSLMVVEGMKTDFQVADSSKIIKTPVSEEVNSHAGIFQSGAEFNPGNLGGFSLSSVNVQLQHVEVALGELDDTEETLKGESIKVSDTRNLFSSQGVSVCTEVLNLGSNVILDEKESTSSQKGLPENKQIEVNVETPEKIVVLQELSKDEEELSTERRNLSEGALVGNSSLQSSAKPFSDVIMSPHTEVVVEQERAWRKVLEKAALALKDAPTAASRANPKQIGLEDSGELSDSLEKKSWGWWGWRGSSPQKKQMIEKPDRRSSRLSRKLSGRNSKSMKDGLSDICPTEAPTEVKDSMTELTLGMTNHKDNSHSSPSSNADKPIEVEIQKDMLIGVAASSDNQGPFSEEGTNLVETGKESVSLSSQSMKGASEQEAILKPRDGLKPTRSILSRVFGGSGRAQSGLQEHAATLKSEHIDVEGEQQKESLVERAEIIAELLERKWSMSSQIKGKDTQRLPLSYTPSMQGSHFAEHVNAINLEEGNSNVEIDESCTKTTLISNTGDSETGEKEEELLRGALLLEGTILPQVQEQTELHNCILDESKVESAFAFSPSNLSVTSRSQVDRTLLLESTTSVENLFVPEGYQVDQHNKSVTLEKKVDVINGFTQEFIDKNHLSENGLKCRDEFLVEASPPDVLNRSIENLKRAEYIIQQDELSDAEANTSERSPSKSIEELEVDSNGGCRSHLTFLGTKVTEDARIGSHLCLDEGSNAFKPERARSEEHGMVDRAKLYSKESLACCDIPDEASVAARGQFEVDIDKGVNEQVDKGTNLGNDDGSQVSYDLQLPGVVSPGSSDLNCDAGSATSAAVADCSTDMASRFSNKTVEKSVGTKSRRYLSFKDLEEYYEPLGSNIDSPVNDDIVTEDVFKSCLALPDLLSLAGEDEEQENSDEAQDLQPVPDSGNPDERHIPLHGDHALTEVQCTESMTAKHSTPVNVPRELRNFARRPAIKHLSESMPNFRSKTIDFGELNAQKVFSCSLGTHSLLEDHHEKPELASDSDNQASVNLTSSIEYFHLIGKENDLRKNSEQEGSKALERPFKSSSPSVLRQASDHIHTYHMASAGGEVSLIDTQVNTPDTGFELSLCKHLLTKGMGKEAAAKAFDSEKLSLQRFKSSGASIAGNEKLVVRVGGKYYPWTVAAPIILGMLAFGQFVFPDTEGEIVVEAPAAVKYPKAVLDASTTSAGLWRLWPFLLRRPKTPEKGNAKSTFSTKALLVASTMAVEAPLTNDFLHKNGYYGYPLRRHILRTKVPTSKQLASLNLKEGKNKITFTFFTNVLGSQQVDAHIYLWKWNARIVISDVDGTITRSDVLGQVMPLVGKDWTQTGVTRLFSAIKDNGYELMFLSARAITQAYITRQFLLNLKQDGEPLPDGPVVISLMD
ncbi:hypothetical protein O6H91_18G068900 [Diphasiastrum complanatum]|uniref:Uncharacterized protein n=1 Tax=Diphasiastrum complanatum TaxID=34168 RepID=A0ACC2B2F6_DIPCM|nr:hypothetical protein O6H91_18G068900 [Diphasiastrum complanatum]